MYSSYKGLYNVKNLSKYFGTQPVIYRSTWEASFMKWCDENPNVTKWGSESIVIPYLSIDNKYHRYFIDFNVTFNNGETYLIEIKPKKKTVPPKLPLSGRKTKRYIIEDFEYKKNVCKWVAAKKFAEKRNMKFKVWTEDTLKENGILIIL